MNIDKYKLLLEILKYFKAQSKPILRANVLGLVDEPGEFERFYDRIYKSEEKGKLDLGLLDLQKKGFICPAYKDIVSRGEDLQITEKGKKALELKALDTLDELLLGINSPSDLITMRYGAYDAILNKERDWPRQAAASLTELIDHTLRSIAPLDKIKEKDWYVPDPTSKNGITRAHKIRFYIEEKKGDRSESTEQIIKKSLDLIEATRSKIEGIKHSSVPEHEIEKLISLVEDVLLFLLS